jgi:hypothetical protein
MNPSLYYSYDAYYHPLIPTSAAHQTRININGAINITSFTISNTIAYLCDSTGAIYSYNLTTGAQAVVFSIANSILPGDIKILAGSNAGKVDAQGTNAKFNYPYGLTAYTNLNILVAEPVNNDIRQINVNSNTGSFANVTTFGVQQTTILQNPQSISLYSNSLYSLCWNSAGLSQIVSVPITSYPSTTFTFSNSTATTEANTYIFPPYPNMYTLSQYAGPPFVFPKQTSSPLVVDPSSGNMYVFDSGNSYIRMITPAGIISTIAGNGVSALQNNAIGSLASFNSTTASQLAITSTGTLLFVADTDVFRVVDLRPGSNYAVTSSASFGGMTGLTVNSTNAFLYVAVGIYNTIYRVEIGNPQVPQQWTTTTTFNNTSYNFDRICASGDYIYACYPAGKTIYGIDVRGSSLDIRNSSAFNVAGGGFGVDDGIVGVGKFLNPTYMAVSDDGTFLYVADGGGYGEGFTADIRRIELLSGQYTMLTITGTYAKPVSLPQPYVTGGLAYDPLQKCIFYTVCGTSSAIGSQVNEIMKLSFNRYSKFNPDPPQSVQLRNATGRQLTIAVPGATVTNPTLYSIPGRYDVQTLYSLAGNTYTLG